MTGESYWPAFRTAVRDDRWFHLFVVLYGLAAMALALFLGRPEKMLALMYARRFLQLVAIVLFAFIAVQALASLRSPSPIRDLKHRIVSRLRPTLAARLLLFANISIFYGIFTSCKRMLSDLRVFTYDEQLADLDRYLHGADPWQIFAYSEGLTRIVQIFYLQGWLLCMVFFSCYVIIAQPRALMQRFVITFYLAWVVLGNVLAGIFMSAGPVYYRDVTGSDRFEPLFDKLEFSFGMASSSVNVQDRLWHDHMLDLGLLGSGISAFPSLHIAMATLWAITSWYINKVLFVLAVLVLIGVQFGSVYLGWHYAVDGYFSFLAVIALWILAKPISERLTRS